MSEPHDVLVLGGGLCGLAAASQLGPHAAVLERADRAGGLVRSTRVGEHWFDDVLHLLYFWDDETERLITGLLGADLVRCPPVAFVETAHGTTRYPIQRHLGSLDLEAAVRCVEGLARVSLTDDASRPPGSFLESLERGFGDGLCDVFMRPYNEKMWKRPLDELAPTGFLWNIPRPDLTEVLRGALDPGHGLGQAYNARGWYPRPPARAPVRGMEVLSERLAATVHDLRTHSEVVAVDLAGRRVRVRAAGVERWHHYGDALSTLPLPATLRLCGPLPGSLEGEVERLVANRVVMVYVAVEGPRPDLGHWRYYSDPEVCFTRLVFMHAFDPDTAPAHGWGLMCELTERGEAPLGHLEDRVARAVADARSVGVLGEGQRVVGTAVRAFAPAYVAFTRDSAEVVEEARQLLRSHGITPLGRYGRWEYSSMAQVMRDGFSWGRQVADRLGYVSPALRWSAAPAPGSAP